MRAVLLRSEGQKKKQLSLNVILKFALDYICNLMVPGGALKNHTKKHETVE
jgi:hypothetical protein